ncbi:Magnetosome protein MamI-g, greigite-specific [Candidatus Magnetomoraceae bacterium gMMP-15]
MKHIIIGLIAITLGLWGIVLNWYRFIDLLWVLIPMAVLIGGIVALMAGISNFSKVPKQNTSTKNSE